MNKLYQRIIDDMLKLIDDLYINFVLSGQLPSLNIIVKVLNRTLSLILKIMNQIKFPRAKMQPDGESKDKARIYLVQRM